MKHTKNAQSNASKTKTNANEKFPFVSICTPTFNRRPFIPYIIKCVEYQTYPKDRMEWIIIDDGADKVQDIFKEAIKNNPLLPTIKYFPNSTHMTLGKKRNTMHEKCCGSIIVYMDDDDYYPPERVSHAVETLLAHPEALCAGSSEMHVYYDGINQLVQCGPYGPSHATAATFAFRKELLQFTQYDNTAAVAEERLFLKNYSIPFVQLETTKTILVFAHIQNSVDKRRLIEEPSQYVGPSPKTVDDFIKHPDLKAFYVGNINPNLITYPLGKPEHKPEMMKQIQVMKEERERMMAPMQDMYNGLMGQMNEMRAGFEKVIQNKDTLIDALMKKIKELKEQNEALQINNTTIEVGPT